MGIFCSRICIQNQDNVNFSAGYTTKTQSEAQNPIKKYRKATEKIQQNNSDRIHNDLQGQKNQIVQSKHKLRSISLKELKKHDSHWSAWTSYNGIVYDVTKYLKKHPGGINKLLRGCGKQCDSLFGIYHQNLDPRNFLKDCIVGYLVKEENDNSIRK